MVGRSVGWLPGRFPLRLAGQGRGWTHDDAVDLLRLAREAEAGEEAAERGVEGEAGERGLRGDVGVQDLGGWWGGWGVGVSLGLECAFGALVLGV